MKQKYKLLSKEVAPADVRLGKQCGAGSCPAVLQREDGKFVVVGKVLNSADRSELEGTGIVRIYGDETAIVVDPLLLSVALGQK